MHSVPLRYAIPYGLVALAAVGLAVLGGQLFRRPEARVQALSGSTAQAEPAALARTILPRLAATPTAFPPAAAEPSETPTPTATSSPSPAPSPTLPEAHFITKISGHHQFFALGCETAAAKDWAIYFRKDFNEYEFQYKLPVSDNPDYGFVGSVNSEWGQVPPYAYGVYAGPVAELLNQYGIQASAYKGYSLDQLKAKIAHDVPVIVWVIGNVVGGIPAEYTDKEGRKTIVAAYEHVVIVTGYDAGHIRYMNNGKFYDTPTKVFSNSWGVLGNMVVVDK
jgi:uncharacterized protein YvpB